MNKPGSGKSDESAIHHSSFTTHNTLVPQLRFPEFRKAGEWDFRELEDACEVNPSNSTLPKSFVYIDLESVEAGQLIKKKKISREGAPSRAQRILRNGDVIFQIVRPYQKNNLFCDFDDDEVYVASTGYAQLRAFDSKEFLYQVIHTHDFVERVLAKCTGSNYPAINSSDLAKIQLAVPAPEEQQKIADCLSSLDAWIAAQAEKIDALKTYKNGLMQQLFPREGETVPRLRFPEFRDAGEWRMISLGEKVDQLSGFPFKGSEISDDPNGTPLMRGINITEGLVRHSPDIDRYFLGDEKPLERYKLKKNDLVIGMDGSKVGKNSALITGKDVGSLLIQRVARLRARRESAIRYIFQHIHSSRFHSYVDRINTSSGIPHISAKQINEFEIHFPPVEGEQQKIADCLSSLDALIAAQAQKVESLKTHKKGLMQQLFPRLEDLKL